MDGSILYLYLLNAEALGKQLQTRSSGFGTPVTEPVSPFTMAVCSYYLRGTCKYGDRCRNEHPVGSGATFGNQTWTSSNNRVAVPYTVETMAADVTPLKDKPLWPLSSYGPAKHEPVVISGLDESPEELHLKAVSALKSGTTDEYTKYEGEKTAAADQVYTNARENVRQLYEQALKISTQGQITPSATSPSVPGLTTSTSSAFGASSNPSAFGGSATTAFGKPAFGQPTFGQTGFGGSASGTSAFGQGAQGTSAFGAPAQGVSVFGQPSQPTSAFPQVAQTTSAFGQSAQSGSAFGQPSAFGATTQPTSAFGQPSTQPTSAFGKPSQPVSVFGQPTQPASAFGQPVQSTSAFAQPSQPTLSFGQTSQPAFGQSSLPAPGGFGGGGSGGFSAFASQPSTFTSAAAPTAEGMTSDQPAFGSTPPVQSAFGTALSAPKSAFGTGHPAAFGPAALSNTLSASSMTSPLSASSPFVVSPMMITPSSEKSMSGAPDFVGAKSAARMKAGADRYLSLLPNDYNEIIPADVKAAFTGAKFEWGKIPDWIPPEEVR